MTDQFDVIILGAGVVGLSAARRVASTGATVALLDPATPGGQGSRAAAGVGIPSLRLTGDPPMHAFVQQARVVFEAELAELAARGVALARPTGIIRVAVDHKSRAQLEQLSERLPELLGRWHDAAELTELEPALVGTPVSGGFVHESGGMVDANGYVSALLHDAHTRGVTVRLGEGALNITEQPTLVEVHTPRDKLRARQLVVAMGAWSGGLPGLPPLPVVPLRGQMLTLLHPLVRLSRIVSSMGGYLAPWHAGEIVVGATEEDVGFAVHSTPMGMLFLTSTVARLAPVLRDAQITQSWAGLRASTPDGRLMLGYYPQTKRVLVASGHGGQGIMTGALTGQIVAELIERGSSKLAAPFDPSRALETSPRPAAPTV